MSQHTWPSGIYNLIETLTCRVRVLSLPQIERGWATQPGFSGGVMNTVLRLVNSRLLDGAVWDVSPSPVGHNSLCSWQPGERQPDLVRLERLVRDRWNRPTHETPVVSATHIAARLFGSMTNGLPPTNHRNHDLLLSEVYLHYCDRHPQLASGWLGEDAVTMAEPGIKNPDAFLFDNCGAIVRVIESAGRYSLNQLEAFHQYCQSEQLPYELW